ncbi:MAG TPA: glycosyltransferase [Ktedonobacterales bacterium]
MLAIMQHGLALASMLLALVTLGRLSLRFALNLRFLASAQRLAASATSGRAPRVSVLVPARNEIRGITACVESLLQQTYPDVELIVLDDGSTDGTTEALAALQSRFPALQVMRDADNPPPGWNGKSAACAQLATHATGEWLLFTDADTIHQPTSVASGLAQALGLRVALLSAIPLQQTRSWSERILVSFILDFLPLVGVDLSAMWSGARGRTVANGQYILAHAESYRALGGHASIATALVDDFALAQRFRESGHTVALVNGVSLLSCRMYTSAGEVWNGFTKNLLGALTSTGERPNVLWYPLFAWGYASVFVLPIAYLIIGEQRELAAVALGWLFLLRAATGIYLKRPLDEILTTPLAAWAVMALALSAMVRRWRGRGIEWKGRQYAS